MATIFSDGFESGDFSAWTSTWTAGDGAVTVVETPHCGTYGSNHAASAESAKAFIYKTTDFGATCYTQLYFRFDQQPKTNTGLYFFVMRSNNKDCVRLSYRDTGGTNYLRMEYDTNGDGSKDTTHNEAKTFAVDTWYCIEVKLVYSDTVGEATVYVNGVSTISKTGLNLGAANFGLLLVGLETYPAQDSTVNINLDCVEVSDSYIGPETSIPVFMHHYTKNVWR